MPGFAATPGAVATFLDRLRPPEAGVYVRPAAFLAGAEARAAVEAGQAFRLAGGELGFLLCELIARDGNSGRAATMVAAPVLESWARDAGTAHGDRVAAQLAALTRARPPFCGIDLVAGSPRMTVVMGVVNVTPDSFSDGGQWLDPDAAIAHGLSLAEAGAEIVDVGGESTRPGAAPVAPDEELRRVLPVVGGLADRGAVVSIDTRRAEVMEAAAAAGARIINDVSALAGDPDSLAAAAKTKAGVILMHMQGEPATMQDDPAYDDAALDVYDFLESRIAACEGAGIPKARIVVDPGIGFGKTKTHNAVILAQLGLYHALGCGVLVGVSRKGFVAGASGGEAPDKRLPGSLAAALDAVGQGVQLVRVHDVAETRQALAVRDSIQGAAGWTGTAGGE